MSTCPTCNKAVYFAEKKTVHGKDYHSCCLKCAECHKTLTAGSLSKHGDKLYCNKPCYASLFGPGGFGRGGTESYVYDVKK